MATEDMRGGDMSVFTASELLQTHADSGRLYYEFLKVQALSTGIYRLPAGAVDPQGPHTEDEIYFVIEGKADIRIGREVHEVDAGSVVYVPAQVKHRFENITKDLMLLVFFAPAEYSLRA
jgi:mannose-6-phosphate isomerase-like protein (cupin superfamily)